MAAGNRDESGDGDGTDVSDGADVADALPEGWRVVLDRSVSFVAGGTGLLGGRPGRLLTLTPAGRNARQVPARRVG